MTVRPILMRTSALAALAATVLVVGCAPQSGSTASDAGSGASSPPPSAQPAPSTASAEGWRACTGEAFDETDSPALEVPTGDFGVVAMKLPSDGPCAGGLVVRTADGVSGTAVRGLDLEPSTAQVVHLRGDSLPATLLRVDSEPHPRGGFQPHLFSVAGGVDEVTVDGAPLLPFVATDGGMAPMTATCTDDGGVAVLSATVSEPPGIVLAWDVEQATYQVGGSTARLVASEQIRDHAADPVLRREMPELFDPQSLFADC